MFYILFFSFFLLQGYGVLSEVKDKSHASYWSRRFGLLLPYMVLHQTKALKTSHLGLDLTVNLTIADGPIRGSVNTTTRRGITYHAYRGIPYAKPPIGDLRFASPQRNAPWNDTLDATEDRSQCVVLSYFSTNVAGNEDCLFINVYTPNVNNTSALPVLVWIHGGGFQKENSSYNNFGPHHFLDEGLVFVSFNYRLGIFGFLSTEDEKCPGNWGIKDQVLALKWVQANVGYFGGDPNNVTIFGESAGAASVSLLMQTNQTTGLFHKAIMNSGTTLNLWSLSTRARTTARLVATTLGVLPFNSASIVAGLRRVGANRLARVGTAQGLLLFVTNAFRGLPYAPVLEPSTVTDAVFTTPSDDTLVAGNFHRVPVLMGFNSNEATYYADIPTLIKSVMLNYDLLSQYLTPYSMTSNIFKRVSVGNQIKFHFSGLWPLTVNPDIVDDLIGDDQYYRPIRRAAESMSNFVDVYLYSFGYEPENSTFDGVGHAQDLAYFFSSSTPPGTYGIDVSKTMVKLWSNFAKYGNPTPYADAALNNTIWAPIDSSISDVAYLTINATISMQVNPRQAIWEFYQKLFDKYGDGSYTTY